VPEERNEWRDKDAASQNDRCKAAHEMKTHLHRMADASKLTADEWRVIHA